MRLPATTISGPAPPISRTSATRCCARLPGWRRSKRPAGRHPVRRRHRADPLPRDRLEPGGGIALTRRQHGEPCRHAGALARRADGGRAWRCGDRDRRRRAARRRAWRHRAQPDRRRRRASFRRAAHEYGARRARADDFLLRAAATKATARRCAFRSTSPIPPMSTAIDIAACDGVGLMRTEFLFGKASGLPDEETQYRAYRKVLEWAGGKPVTIRTVDAGGDKPVPGFTGRREQPVPRPARHPAVAGAPGDLPRADPGAAARRAARQSQGDVPDDRRCRTNMIAPPRCSRRSARDLARQGRAAPSAAAWHHGRGAARWRSRREAFADGAVLLDRLQRSDAICDGGGARQRRRSAHLNDGAIRRCCG